MIIHPKAKPERTAGSRIDGDDITNNAYLDVEHSLLLTTKNGAVAAAIDVITDESDVSGTVPIVALQLSRKLPTYQKGTLITDANTVTALNGEVFERPGGDFPPVLDYFPRTQPSYSVGVNARSLVDVCYSLAQINGKCTLHIWMDNDKAKVVGVTTPQGRGVVMPLLSTTPW